MREQGNFLGGSSATAALVAARARYRQEAVSSTPESQDNDEAAGKEDQTERSRQDAVRRKSMKNCKYLLYVLGFALASEAVATAGETPKLTFKFSKVNVPGALQTYTQ